MKNNSGVKPAGQCGTWVKEPEGGLFTSPNYPSKYPPDTECVYILEGKAFFQLWWENVNVCSMYGVKSQECYYSMWLVQAAIFKRAQTGFHWWAGVINNINKRELN